jgi:predicted 3-demethylubiquinone-9 3-methyltransferase (glyoxalase superfamily)
MTSISPCLWFDGQAEQAASFYVSLFPDSRIDKVSRAPSDYPAGKKGDALTVEFTLAGRHFIGLNGGPYFQFNEAVSMSISVEGQAEVDRLWSALTAEGGAPGQCGWLKDRWGLSWQVVPSALPRLLGHPDPEAAGRAMQAMMGMRKIDIAELERAAAGGTA